MECRFSGSLKFSTMNSSNKAEGFTPAAIKSAAEMPSPTTSAPARISACNQGHICCRSSRLSLLSRHPLPAPFVSSGCAAPEEAPAPATVLLSMMHHDAADGLAIGRCRKLCSDTATSHHADTIGEIEHLVEVIADQYDGHAVGACFEQSFLHGRTRANVEATAWTMRDDDLRVAGEFASDDELLRVAAGELSRALPQRTHALNVKFTDGLSGRLAHGGPIGAHPRAISASSYLADTE